MSTSPSSSRALPRNAVLASPLSSASFSAVHFFSALARRAPWILRPLRLALRLRLHLHQSSPTTTGRTLHPHHHRQLLRHEPFRRASALQRAPRQRRRIGTSGRRGRGDWPTVPISPQISRPPAVGHHLASAHVACRRELAWRMRPSRSSGIGWCSSPCRGWSTSGPPFSPAWPCRRPSYRPRW